jgi:hypothetical protein
MSTLDRLDEMEHDVGVAIDYARSYADDVENSASNVTSYISDVEDAISSVFLKIEELHKFVEDMNPE